MNKHQHHNSLQTIPFSWEHLPGVSKAAPRIEQGSKKFERHPVVSSAKENLAHGLYVPLPPCPYRANANTTCFIRPEEDPFLAAYIECTKNVMENEKEEIKREEKKSVKRRSLWAKIEKFRFGFGLDFGLSSTCKSSIGVREGIVVKSSNLTEVDYHVDELD